MSITVSMVVIGSTRRGDHDLRLGQHQRVRVGRGATTTTALGGQHRRARAVEVAGDDAGRRQLRDRQPGATRVRVDVELGRVAGGFAARIGRVVRVAADVVVDPVRARRAFRTVRAVVALVIFLGPQTTGVVREVDLAVTVVVAAIAARGERRRVLRLVGAALAAQIVREVGLPVTVVVDAVATRRTLGTGVIRRQIVTARGDEEEERAKRDAKHGARNLHRHVRCRFIGTQTFNETALTIRQGS
jgi:hypothetical protein